MLEKGFLKPRLTYKHLDKNKLLVGILFWFISSIILYIGINYYRELLRASTWSPDRDMFIISDSDFSKMDLFYAFFSVIVSFGLISIFWVYNIDYRKKRYKIRYAASITIMYLFLVLAIIHRFGTNLYLILYNQYGYSNELDLINDFSIVFILVPIYLYFTYWNIIRQIFRIKYLSFICLICISFTSNYLLLRRIN